MQKRESLCAGFCSSRPAEEASGVFWIIIELTSFVVKFQAQPGIPQVNLENQGKQGCLCVCAQVA